MANIINLSIGTVAIIFALAIDFAIFNPVMNIIATFPDPLSVFLSAVFIVFILCLNVLFPISVILADNLNVMNALAGLLCFIIAIALDWAIFEPSMTIIATLPDAVATFVSVGFIMLLVGINIFIPMKMLLADDLGVF